jgi:Flp pilus assembly protein TadG
VTGLRERGGATVEMVIIAPLLIMMMLFVVGLGRLASTREVVDGAARDGAREASMARNPSDAVHRAQAVVQSTLQGRQVTCQSLHVNTDATNATFQPGGTVKVDVSCTVVNSDVVLSGLPGSATLHGTSAAPIDQYRGVG